MPIPTVVSHAEFIEALKPLWDLLGVSSGSVFADFAITHGAIEFAVPVKFEQDPKGRPNHTLYWGDGVPTAFEHPQGVDVAPHVIGEGEVAEWAFKVRVAIGHPSDREDVA